MRRDLHIISFFILPFDKMSVEEAYGIGKVLIPEAYMLTAQNRLGIR
jgi:hypothetical protein